MSPAIGEMIFSLEDQFCWPNLSYDTASDIDTALAALCAVKKDEIGLVIDKKLFGGDTETHMWLYVIFPKSVGWVLSDWCKNIP
jgi:hypothetical protein